MKLSQTDGPLLISPNPIDTPTDRRFLIMRSRITRSIRNLIHAQISLRVPLRLFAAALLIAVCTVTSAFGAATATLSAKLSSTAPFYTDNLSATVTVSGSGAAPTGSIYWSTDSGSQKTAQISQGIARLNLQFFAPGQHSLTYSYSGDANYGASAAQTVPFTVADRPFAVVGGESSFLTRSTYPNIVNVALDSKHNLYLDDAVDNAIYKADINHNVTTVATNGLNRPSDIILDSSDTLYIADAGNARIVAITASGSQSTLPITGLIDPVVVALDPAFKTLYVADQGNGNVIEYNLAAKTQKAIATNLSPLSGIAVADSGEIYLSTSGGNSNQGDIYLLDNSNNITELYTGIPGPGGLVFRNGNIYTNSSIGVIEYDAQGHLNQLSYGQNGGIGVVGGNLVPLNLAIDTLGNTYRTDGGAVKFLVPGLSANAGVGPSGQPSSQAEFVVYYQVAYQQSVTALNLPANAPINPVSNQAFGPTYSPDFNVPYLWESEFTVSPQVPGPFSTYITVTDSNGATHTALVYGLGLGSELAIAPGNTTEQALSVSSVGGIAQDSSQNLYLTDTTGNKVLEVTGSGSTTLSFAGLNQPTQIAVDGAGSVYVLNASQDSSSAAILKLDPQNKQTKVFALSSQTALTSLESFAIDGGGNLYLGGQAESGGSAIYYIDTLGNQTLFAANVTTPAQLILDGLGDVFSLESASGVVRKFDPSGNPSVFISGLTDPTSVAIDPSGTAYVTGAAGSGITVLDPSGDVTKYPLATLDNASAVAVNGSGSLAVADSSGRQVFSVQRGQVSGDSSSQYTYAFGNVAKGATKTIPGYLANVGNLSSQTIFILPPFDANPSSPDFAFTSANGACISDGSATNPALDPGQSCGLSLSFTPSSVGSQTSGSFGPSLIPLLATGTGVAATSPTLSISPSTIQFPSTAAGATSAAQVLTVKNIGAATANISTVTLAGVNPGDFALTNGCNSTLAVNATCTLSVVFTPAAASTTYTALVSVASDDPNSPATAALSGISPGAAAPTATLTPASFAFGSVATGATATTTLTLANTGTVDISINSHSALTAPLSLTGTTCSTTLAKGASCTYVVSFSPTETGSISQIFSVTDSAGTQSSALTGNGVSGPATTPAATLTPSSLDFGSVQTGITSAAKTATLTSTGTAALAISSIQITGANAAVFASTNNCGTSLAIGASCTISVTFAPTATGSDSASITVADNAPGSPQTVTLTGTAAAPPVAADFTIAATPSTQSVTAGASANYAINLASSGSTFTDAVVLSVSGLPAGATATFTPASVTPGTDGVSSAMSVQTAIPSAAQQARQTPGKSPWPTTAAIISTALLILPFRKRKRLASLLTCMGLAILALTSLTACGGGFALPKPPQPPATYTLTVTGTSGSIQHSTTVQITVR